MKVYQVSFAEADQTLHGSICGNPLPMLAAVVGILGKSEESPLLSEADKGGLRESMAYLSERITTVTSLVDPSAPKVN